jgi:hypothetical protein
LRRTAPNAFAGQIRRALEYVCQDQNAAGRTLFHQLEDLANRGLLPAALAETTAILRKAGNIGVHADEEDIDVWDAELIDELFRLVIEYVYIAPAKTKRLQTRMRDRAT